MPTSVEASNGIFYHLWQLPDLSAPEPEITYEYPVIDNDLGDGYRSGLLVGASAGLRTWRLTLPTLASGEVLTLTRTGVKGETVSREQYVRSLFAENRVTGEPFVLDDTTGGETEYVFVDFADQTLSMKRLRVKIYSTGIVLKERRMYGVTL